MTPTTWAWFVALVGWTALLSFYDLDGGAGLEPVEAWVTQPAREMYENIDEMWANREEAGWQWRPIVIPEFCGETRMQKSPGAYWAVCLTSYLRGTPVDEVSARIPNAIAALLMVVTVFWLTRRIAGDRAAIFAGFAAASSTMVLYWSHNAASDMGVATLITMSLACLWVGSEDEPPGWKRNGLWLAGYFFAGLAMIYKMPLAIPCVGLPAFLYVLLRNRWKIFASGWHLLGLGLFLLPWLPWALAAMHFEDMTLIKWRVEYFDRVTGDLPNVDDQKNWYWFLFYVGVALLLTIPYALSAPLALARPFRRQEGVNRNGMYFVLIWFASLLIFFSVAIGKETRYFLPGVPPLLVLLGIELSSFFDPRQRVRPTLNTLGLVAVCVLVPGVLVGLGFLLRRFWEQHIALGIAAWPDLLQPYVVAAFIFAAGAIAAAWLYRTRRAHASFAALVAAMWVAWLWTWPKLMPILASQAPFKDFAAQLASLAPEHQPQLRQVAHQDPRYIWYSDVRFPRVIDQLELLETVGGRRDPQREILVLGEEMIEQLQLKNLVLFVASPEHYVFFHAASPVLLALEARNAPKTYVWRTATTGRVDRRYIVFGNRPPPWDEPELPPILRRAVNDPPEDMREAIEELVALKRGDLTPAAPSEPVTPLPDSQPVSQPAIEP